MAMAHRIWAEWADINFNEKLKVDNFLEPVGLYCLTGFFAPGYTINYLSLRVLIYSPSTIPP
jgi:hypothetical protein